MSTTSRGSAFEKRVARWMRWHGYLDVKVNGKSGDYGVDVTARTFLGRKVVVQCKCYRGKVGIDAVQEIIAGKQYYRAGIAVVATNSTLTANAKKLADKCGVQVWERM